MRDSFAIDAIVIDDGSTPDVVEYVQYNSVGSERCWSVAVSLHHITFIYHVPETQTRQK